jgi:hypothetical protein
LRLQFLKPGRDRQHHRLSGEQQSHAPADRCGHREHRSHA